MLHDFLVLLGSCALPAASWIALVVLHEFAHAVTARLLGQRVRAIEFGTGPAALSRWLGATQVIVRRWPLHGLVRVFPTRRRGMRARQVLYTAAGPVMSLACAIAVHLLVGHLEAAGDSSGALHASVLVVKWLAWALAIAALLPMGGGSHDTLQIVALLLVSDADLDVAWRELQQRRLHADFWAAFLDGRMPAAVDALGAEPEAPEARCSWHGDMAFLAFARDGVSAAIVHQELAETAAAAVSAGLAANGGRTAPKELQGWRGTERALRVNRAYFLVHSDDPADLAAAAALAQSWQGKAPADSPTRTGELRTRGLVLLHTGHVGAGIGEVRRSLAGAEAPWLRAQSAAYLAYGYALRGETAKVRRYIRMALRLEPRSPLLALRLRLVDAALQAAAERAPSPAMR